MLRFLVAALVFLLFVTGCAPMVASLQENELKGSGNIVAQDFSFDKANQLVVASNFRATFSTGDKVSVSVHADDNVMGFVYVHVSNGQLRLEMKPGRAYNMTKVTLKAEVTMPAPDSITLQDNGALDVSGIRAADVKLQLKGNGILTGKDVSIPRLGLTSEGNGMTQLSGAIAELTIDGSGNTKFTCPNTQVHTARIHLKDNGAAALYVTDSLDYDVSGNAGIVYSGTPKLGEQKRSGNASVTQK